MIDYPIRLSEEGPNPERDTMGREDELEMFACRHTIRGGACALFLVLARASASPCTPPRVTRTAYISLRGAGAANYPVF